MKIGIYHNALWARYKGSIFSCLKLLADEASVSTDFVQIAWTTHERGSSLVDLSYHRYPYRLLFNGVYEHVPKLSLCRRLFTEALSSNVDLLVIPGYHLLEYWFMLLGCLISGKKRGIFVDSTRYENPPSRIRDALKRCFLTRCDIVFCYGERSKAYVSLLGVPAERIVSGCHAAALPHSYSAATALEMRLQMCSKPGRQFLFVGRLADEKGLPVLLRAFARVFQLDPTVRLVLVGEGPERHALGALAERLGIGQAVEFAGPADIESLALHYLKANCLVLPSEREPWGLVVNESLSYGCPAIVSDRCGCVDDLIQDGKTGYVFRAGNVDDLFEKLLLVRSNLNDCASVAAYSIAVMQQFKAEDAARRMLVGIRQLEERTDRKSGGR